MLDDLIAGAFDADAGAGVEADALVADDATSSETSGAEMAPTDPMQSPPIDAMPEQVDAAPADGALNDERGKRVLLPEADAPKLHKVLAQSGVGSRRDMEAAIEEGRVTVNGERAHTGQRISFGDRIALDGKPVRVRIAPPPARVIAYHKPVGEIVSLDDPQQRPTVFRKLPRLAHGKWQSVGRLDINTEGLLLFTTSGDLANQLMHPRFGVEREYAVRVLGTLDDEARAKLLAGVEIDGQPASFKALEDLGGEGANRWHKVVITEGRNREVRRLFEAVGMAVSRLIRVRYGAVVLPRGLRRGAWVDLDLADVKQLRRLTAQPAQPRADGGDQPPRQGQGQGQRQERGDRPARGERGERADRSERGERRARPDGGPDTRRDDGLARRGNKRRRGGDRADRPDRPDRIDRPERGDGPGAIPNPLQQTFDKRAIREARQPRREYGDDGPIPNPLQQTYDKRALKDARSPRREYGDDGPIPNPLQQTYDKRALKESRPQRELGDDGPIPNPLQQTYDKRFVQGQPRSARPGGGGRGGKSGGGAKGRGGRPGGGGGGGGTGAGQPDPMKTAVGYIGANALHGKKGGRGRRGGR